MGLLIGWTLSIITSIGLAFSLDLKVLKEFAEEGYKLNMKKHKENNNTLKFEKNENMIYLIPIVNIIAQFEKLLKYNESKYNIFNQFRIDGVIEKFTKAEQELYNSNPTGLKALFITKKHAETEINNFFSISFVEEDQINKMWFKVIEKKFKVTKSEGPVSKLLLEEQQVIFDKKMKNKIKNLKSEQAFQEWYDKLFSGETMDITVTFKDLEYGKYEEKIRNQYRQAFGRDILEDIDKIMDILINEKIEKDIDSSQSKKKTTGIVKKLRRKK